MPTEAQHNEIKERNKRFQKELNTGRLSDSYYSWQIVAMFYSAFHIMSITLHYAGYHDFQIKKHSLIFEAINDDCITLKSNYEALYEASILARYKYHIFSPADVSEASETLKTLEGAARIERERMRKEKK